MTGHEIFFFEIKVRFDVGLKSKISDHWLTLFFFSRIIILIVKNDQKLESAVIFVAYQTHALPLK
jgi:hypothetical protein